ncbi:MAG: gluconate 2-dehydrogenase subunit 3 family protein [Vicinamibacterales bacterium]
MSLNRRDVLRSLAAGVAIPLGGSLFPAELLEWGREVHAAVGVAGQSAAGTSLSPAVLQSLALACERIIPTDDTPGAAAAGVPAFIGHMLSDWYDEPERTRVIAGIESIDSLARARHQRSFASCAIDQQDALLLELDREGPAHWFSTVKYLTIWGYYTSEVGVVRELGQWPSPGRYDGNAPYTPRTRTV